MEDLFTDKGFSNNLSCSNVKKRKVIIIMYLKRVQNNDTMNLALFSNIKSHVLTTKKCYTNDKKHKMN